MPNRHLQKWNFHKEVYLSELRRRLEECRVERVKPPTEGSDSATRDGGSGLGIDRIKCGEIWDSFIAQISSSLGQGDVEDLLQLISIYQPCRIRSSLPLSAQLHLKRMSEAGDESILEFENDIEKWLKAAKTGKNEELWAFYAENSDWIALMQNNW